MNQKFPEFFPPHPFHIIQHTHFSLYRSATLSADSLVRFYRKTKKERNKKFIAKESEPKQFLVIFFSSLSIASSRQPVFQ